MVSNWLPEKTNPGPHVSFHRSPEFKEPADSPVADCTSTAHPVDQTAVETGGAADVSGVDGCG